MGAEGYIWITKFKKNLADALQAAREETFASGMARNPVRGHCWTSSQSVKPRNSVLSAR